MKIPTHVAIILDGNGRWAKAHGKPRSFGHAAGAKTMLRILEDADALGIKYLTVYAFSTENWNRPKREVAALMRILRKELIDSVERSMKNNVRCMVIGDRARLSRDIVDAIEHLEQATADNTGLHFTIAINYGARDEIVRAAGRIAADIGAGVLDRDALDEKTFSSYLDTRMLPDPDLMIRTCNEQRISNFLLWQCAYTEFFYTDKTWPEFTKETLLEAIEAYGGRTRKFGKVIEEQSI